jgi:hypothetical protein
MLKQVLMVAAVLVSVGIACGATVSGELKVWHKVTLDIAGPETSEMAEVNPFMNYRLNVTFAGPSGQRYVVPGYYAADGNAGQTGADSGSVWRAHLAPDEKGRWTYSVSFRKGEQIAVSEDAAAGEPVPQVDGQTGAFEIAPTDKTGRDFRGKGMLRYVGGHYPQFAGTGEFFLKQGADAPENLLAYADFDGDFKTDGIRDEFIKTWAPHVKDWKPGDPTWQNGKGKGLIGALNYLHAKGLNAVSFLTFNIEGDDRNVFPYTGYKEKFRLDVSRLAQWEIVFEHAQSLGLFLHFKTQESENETWHDNGAIGPERRLYYRELIARFAHHPALNWNLGEENGKWSDKELYQTTAQRREMADYFWTHDPYRHMIVIHNGYWFNDVIGDQSRLTGASLQTDQPDFSKVHRLVLQLVRQSAATGKPWHVACDEPGDAEHALVPDADDPTHDNARKNALWGTLMAGGWGNEWYFGYAHAHSDLTCQDWRSRDAFWDLCRIALEFFSRNNIPFWEMSNRNELTRQENDYCFVKDGEVYLIYQKQAEPLEFVLSEGRFEYGYVNPRTGDGTDKLIQLKTVTGPAAITVTPPDAKDWLLVIRSDNGGTVSQAPATAAKRIESMYDGQVFEEADGLLAVEAELFAEQTKTEKRQWYITAVGAEPGVHPDGDGNHAESASGQAYLELLPDTRRTHDDPLIGGENFTNEPGQMAVLSYPVMIHNPGRYYVWVRAFSTGSEDNGLHVGLDGKWPDSGRRMQWCEGKNSWRWESKQRTEADHCGEPHKIYLDILQPGLHTIEFSMREDGFEFDKFILTQDKQFERPEDAGPAMRAAK